MKNAYFVFEFAIDERVRRMGFTLPSMDKAALDQLGEDVTEHACESDIESDYGVHDGGGTWNDRTEQISFSSYEVTEDRIDALMEEWREFFVQKFGEDNVGPVTELPPPEDLDDDYAALSGQAAPQSRPMIHPLKPIGPKP